MRPRFMNRGSDEAPMVGSEYGCASMRPRFMNRGSAILIRIAHKIGYSFNEAPIHESGKSCLPLG